MPRVRLDFSHGWKSQGWLEVVQLHTSPKLGPKGHDHTCFNLPESRYKYLTKRLILTSLFHINKLPLPNSERTQTSFYTQSPLTTTLNHYFSKWRPPSSSLSLLSLASLLPTQFRKSPLSLDFLQIRLYWQSFRQGQLGEVVREIIYTLPGGVVVTRTLVAPTPATTEWATRTVLPEA